MSETLRDVTILEIKERISVKFIHYYMPCSAKILLLLIHISGVQIFSYKHVTILNVTREMLKVI